MLINVDLIQHCSMNPLKRFKQGSDRYLHFFILHFLNVYSSNSMENGTKGQEGQFSQIKKKFCFLKSIAEYLINI